MDSEAAKPAGCGSAMRTSLEKSSVQNHNTRHQAPGGPGEPGARLDVSLLRSPASLLPVSWPRCGGDEGNGGGAVRALLLKGCGEERTCLRVFVVSLLERISRESCPARPRVRKLSSAKFSTVRIFVAIWPAIYFLRGSGPGEEARGSH